MLSCIKDSWGFLGSWPVFRSFGSFRLDKLWSQTVKNVLKQWILTQWTIYIDEILHKCANVQLACKIDRYQILSNEGQGESETLICHTQRDPLCVTILWQRLALLSKALGTKKMKMHGLWEKKTKPVNGRQSSRGKNWWCSHVLKLVIKILVNLQFKNLQIRHYVPKILTTSRIKKIVSKNTMRNLRSTAFQRCMFRGPSLGRN